MNQPDLNNSFPTRNGMDAPATIYTLGDLQQGPPCCIPTPILDIQDLRVAYNGVVALDDLSLQINKNCITALIGPSGAAITLPSAMASLPGWCRSVAAFIAAGSCTLSRCSSTLTG